MKIGIIGPGAIGTLLAARIQRTSVILFDHREDRAHFLRQTGVCVDEFHQNPQITTCWKEVLESEYLLLTTKAHHVPELAKAFQTSKYHGKVVILQNGIGQKEMLLEANPSLKVFSGILTYGVILEEPGRVRLTGEGTILFPNDEALDSLSEVLTQSGFEVKRVSHFLRACWQKLLVNSVINPITGILGIPNGELIKTSSLKPLIEALLKEGIEVAQKLGLSFSFEEIFSYLTEICTHTEANRSSLLQDLENGRKTEIEFLNGALLQEGKRFHLPCPSHQVMLSLVKAKEPH